jgi:hypothetical protein
MRRHNIRIRTFHGKATLKEFEKGQVIELRRKALQRRLDEINAAAKGPPIGDNGRDRWGSIGSIGRGVFRSRRNTATLDDDAA